MIKNARRANPTPGQLFDFLQKFNQLVTLDEEVARRLPAREFELSFDKEGRVYVDGEPLSINVKAAGLYPPASRVLERTNSEAIRVKKFAVTAWNNGKFNRTGAGYGLRLHATDRDAVFSRSWSDVVLSLPSSKKARVRLSSSFWRDCPELRSAEIGRWLISAGYGRWPERRPPTFIVIRVSGNYFRVALS